MTDTATGGALMSTSAPVAVTGIDCVCYLAQDYDRAIRFYEGVLGLRPTATAGQWREYEFAGGSTFAMTKLPGDAFYKTGGAMFAVDDVEAALAAVVAGGGKAYTGADESSVCTTAWCEDTEGNNFALHKRKTA